MKTYIPYSLLAALAATGMAYGASTAYTTPVGYETLAVSPGFNFLGLRLQQPVVAAGAITAKSATSLTVGTLDLGALLADTTTYILDIKNANGVTQEFIGSAASGSVLTTPTGLSDKVTVGDSYAIRTAPTLSSTFGAANQAGLEASFLAFGGDIVLLPNPATPGGFDQYYYDSGLSSWADVNGAAVNGASIAWNYADGLLISATGGGLSSLVISGEVKTAKTAFNLVGNSINFLSSVSPAGATLSSAFGASNQAGLDGSFLAFGGDVVMVPNPSTAGGFDQFYYDTGLSSWADVNGAAVVGSSVVLTSGILISNDGGVADVVSSPPSNYSSL